MPNPIDVSTKLHSIANTIEEGHVHGAIDWRKALELVMQLLPLIMAFFAEPTPQPPAKRG